MKSERISPFWVNGYQPFSAVLVCWFLSGYFNNIRYNLFTVLFSKDQFPEYFRSLMQYVLVVFFSCITSFFICQLFHTSLWVTLILRGIICIIVPNLIYFLVYRKKPEFYQSLQLLDNVTKGVFGFARKLKKYERL